MKSVVILSGGMDSSTLLNFFQSLSGVKEVSAISFNYGQRHSKELEFAQWQAHNAGIDWKCVDLSCLETVFEESNSSLVNKSVEVPEGHYASENMKATVVPNRNMIMISIATAWAISKKYNSVAYAAHSGDHAIYPDCRDSFAQNLAEAVSLCDWRKITLDRPFIDIDKAGIVRIGNQCGVDFTKTWSCYKGGDLHCGNCGTCVERREAFLIAGVDDPTQYGPECRPLDDMLKKGVSK